MVPIMLTRELGSGRSQAMDLFCVGPLDTVGRPSGKKWEPEEQQLLLVILLVKVEISVTF